jgi:hypothetical protein
MITFDYVQSNRGDYAIQVYNDYGYFTILTDDLEYPQGIGWATEWETVDRDDVPSDIREALDQAFQGYLDYLEYMDSLDNPIGNE